MNWCGAVCTVALILGRMWRELVMFSPRTILCTGPQYSPRLMSGTRAMCVFHGMHGRVGPTYRSLRVSYEVMAALVRPAFLMNIIKGLSAWKK